MERAIMCPQCNAPLTPHRFARSIVCSYCGTTVFLDETSVSASTFRQAFRTWNAPESYHISSWISIGDRHWAVEKFLAAGDSADVYTGRLARWPTELVLLKILRNPRDADLFDNEWDALQRLQNSDAPGAGEFTRLIPQPVLHGDITAGSFTGRRASIFRWASGFYHTFEDVIRAYPQGIPPRASIWVWRRILEVLAFIHASGMAHGAVLPPHLLAQKDEHGVRLVGYSYAGRLGEKLRPPSAAYASYYPNAALSSAALTAQLDIVMSARCIVALLGGDPATTDLPKAVPARLASTLQRVALSPARVQLDAWSIREELGQLAREIFGPSQFVPIVMPP